MQQLVYVVIWIIMMCQTDINFPQHCIIPQYGWIFPEVLSHYLSKQWSSVQFIIGPNKWTWCPPQPGKKVCCSLFYNEKINDKICISDFFLSWLLTDLELTCQPVSLLTHVNYWNRFFLVIRTPALKREKFHHDIQANHQTAVKPIVWTHIKIIICD